MRAPIPFILQVSGCNLCQFTFSEQDEVTATPKLGVHIGALVHPTHQCLVRNILMKFVKYVGATFVIKGVGLVEELLFKLGRASVDVHDLGGILDGLIVRHFILRHLAPPLRLLQFPIKVPKLGFEILVIFLKEVRSDDFLSFSTTTKTTFSSAQPIPGPCPSTTTGPPNQHTFSPG